MAARSAGSLALPSATGTGAVARVSGLTRRFGSRSVLESLDLTISPGEIVALIGRSGSGKSTLLRVMAGLDDRVEGEVEIDGTIGVAFQESRLVPWRNVLDNVSLGLRGRDPVTAARTALAEVGLESHAAEWPLTLSGGEAQRVSLARALVREPSLLLLDEPFGALDALTRITMHRLMLELWEEHRPAILLVTHDVDEALALADRVLVLTGGRIGHQTTIELPRPRERDHQELISLRNRLLSELGVDMKGTR
jgi:sulfonate transport system ATP-binding protein